MIMGVRQAAALRLAPWFRFHSGLQMREAWELSQQRAVRVIRLETALTDALETLRAELDTGPLVTECGEKLSCHHFACGYMAGLREGHNAGVAKAMRIVAVVSREA